MERNVIEVWNVCNEILLTELRVENQNIKINRTMEKKVEYILNEVRKRYCRYLPPEQKFDTTNKNVDNSQRQHKEQRINISYL